MWRWRRRAVVVLLCLPPLGRTRNVVGIERMARRVVWMACELLERKAVRKAAQRGVVFERKREIALSGTEDHVFVWHQWVGMGKEEVGGWLGFGG